MEKVKEKSINELLSERKSQLAYFFLAILIGTGIVFCSLSIFSSIDVTNKEYFFLLIGILLCLIGFSYFVYSLFVIRTINKKIKAFIIIKRENNEIISIDNYDFSRKIEIFLKAAICESKAISMDLDAAVFKYDGEKDSVLKGVKIINELTEYYLIDTLSTHLNDYFIGINDKNLLKFNRSDLQEVLLKNQFLELFSKQMENRDAFNNCSDELFNGNSVARILIKKESTGALFQRLDFILPIRSEISKDENNYFSIKTKKVIFKFKSRYESYGTNLPIGFLKYYLGINDPKQYSVHQVYVDFDIKYRFSSFLFSNAWKYYQWIDSFLEKVENQIGLTNYFDKIGWEKAYVILKIKQNKL